MTYLKKILCFVIGHPTPKHITISNAPNRREQNWRITCRRCGDTRLTATVIDAGDLYLAA